MPVDCARHMWVIVESSKSKPEKVLNKLVGRASWISQEIPVTGHCL